MAGYETQSLIGENLAKCRVPEISLTIGLKASAIGPVGRKNANWPEPMNIRAKLPVSLERGGDSDGYG